MRFEVVFILSLLSLISGETNYEYSKHAKDCIKELETTEETIRGLVKETGPIPEDNELVLKFFKCIFSGYISDSNVLIVNDGFTNYVTNAFAVRLDGRHKLGKLLAEDCIKHCKDIKGDSKGKTAVKVMNCLKDKLHEYIDK